jgi:hypothetical protein
MRYLLHGVVRRAAFPLLPNGELPSFGHCRIVTANRLGAVVSETSGGACFPRPRLSALIAFEEEVAAIHDSQTIIPMRYGCWVDSLSGIVQLLEDHYQEYEAALARLDGMTEMGIRVVLCRFQERPVPPATSPGAAYLAGLRSRCHAGRDLSSTETALVERIAASLSSHCVEQRWEIVARSQERLLSLYFLVPRLGVNAFRVAAREVGASNAIRILLSGPWPAYNFVADAQKYYGARSMVLDP